MENTRSQTQELNLNTAVIAPEQLLNHWQGHRRLTRRVIEAFPADALFTYRIGGMRPFYELAMEMVHIAAPGIQGIATGQWPKFGEVTGFTHNEPRSKEELLQLWDEVTEVIDATWPRIPQHRFQEVEAAFGLYEAPIYSNLLYFIDNEIHHRGQGYVYLRALGIEPPHFWERE